MRHIIHYILTTACAVSILTGCIEDGFTTSPSSQPRTSVDTLALGTLFTAEPTPTYSFKIFNPHSKSLNISSITMRDDPDRYFRLNVDGIAADSFTDIEIRHKDSIFVFVEATLPDLDLNRPTNYKRHLDITTNGVTSTVVITATGLDATRLRKQVISEDTRLNASRPYIIYDTLRIKPGATLTLEAGTRLHFHDKAALIVDGTLHSLGTPDATVEMTGDRWGNVVGRVDYEIMSGQWNGVYFSPSSHDNSMEYTSIRNTTDGVTVDSVPYTGSTPSLRMLNCQLRNSKGYVLVSSYSSVEALGCELTDASMGVVALQGGIARLVNCTIANYYLFSVLGGPALQFYHSDPDNANPDTDLPLLSAAIDNCIIYGNGYDLSHGDLTGTDIYLRNCLLKSEGSDDDNFISCLWGLDPLYGTVRQDYHFDYRLQPESPAIGAADPALIPVELTDDLYGHPRLPDLNLGAYAQPIENPGARTLLD